MASCRHSKKKQRIFRNGFGIPAKKSTLHKKPCPIPDLLKKYITPHFQIALDKVQHSKYFSAQNNEPMEIPLYLTDFMPEEHMPSTISAIQGTRDFNDAQILLREKGIPITMTLKQHIQKWDDRRENAAKNRRILAIRRQKFQIDRRKHLIETGQDIPNP